MSEHVLHGRLYSETPLMTELRLKEMTTLASSGKCRCEDEHRCNDPFDGRGRHIFTFGLVNESHSHVPEVKGHAVHKGLPRVCPVLWKLWGKGNEVNVYEPDFKIKQNNIFGMESRVQALWLHMEQ